MQLASPTGPGFLPLLLLAMMPTAALAGPAGSSKAADVIVVGAGLAGLQAASTLSASGLSVIVLEARDRVGGRTWSQPITLPGGKQVFAEAGAAWVHGVTGNPTIQLAKEANVAVAAEETDYENNILFLANNRRARDRQQDRFDAIFETFAEDFLVEKQEQLEESEGPDPGLAPAVEEFIRVKGLSGGKLRAFRYELNVNLEHEFSGGIGQMSLFFDEGKEIVGGDVFVTGGYQNLASYLARNLDVRLGVKVTKIDSSSPSAIQLTTASGEVYAAQRVVCAVPLGVLKAQQAQQAITFIPPLPAANQAAIQRLGVGLLNKVILVFPRVFWPKGIEFINRISRAADGAWQEFACAHKATGAPVLVAFNAADYARSLEAKSDEQVLGDVLGVLRKLFGAAVPNPTTYIITRWGADPLAQGSYSFLATGSTPRDRTRAAAAVGGRLFFAGEHTRTDYPATTHGALLSGKSAACEVLKSLGKGC